MIHSTSHDSRAPSNGDSNHFASQLQQIARLHGIDTVAEVAETAPDQITIRSNYPEQHFNRTHSQQLLNTIKAAAKHSGVTVDEAQTGVRDIEGGSELVVVFPIEDNLESKLAHWHQRDTHTVTVFKNIDALQNDWQQEPNPQKRDQLLNNMQAQLESLRNIPTVTTTIDSHESSACFTAGLS